MTVVRNVYRICIVKISSKMLVITATFELVWMVFTFWIIHKGLLTLCSILGVMLEGNFQLWIRGTLNIVIFN